jgi:hypothetical protein
VFVIVEIFDDSSTERNERVLLMKPRARMIPTMMRKTTRRRFLLAVGSRGGVWALFIMLVEPLNQKK